MSSPARGWCRCTLLALLASLLAAASLGAASVVRPGIARAEIKRSVSPGAPFNPTAFAVSPPIREFRDVQPGSTLTFQMTVQNRMNKPLDVVLRTGDLEGSDNPSEVLREVRQGRFGLGSWLSAEAMQFHLENGERIEQAITVRVPEGVGGGSYYGTIGAVINPGAAVAAGAGVRVGAQVPTEVFVTVAGDQKVGGRIDSVDSPLVATHRRRSLVPFEVVWKNTGNVTDAVGGTFRVKTLFGNDAFKAKFKPALVLRGGRRQFRVVWSETPWIGMFRPTVTMVGRSGDRQVRTLPWMIVMPPWYFSAGVLLAIVLPVWRWRANRRRWNRLVAELYGEEHWDDDDFDGDDWDGEDYGEGWHDDAQR